MANPEWTDPENFNDAEDMLHELRADNARLQADLETALAEMEKDAKEIDFLHNKIDQHKELLRECVPHIRFLVSRHGFSAQIDTLRRIEDALK